MERNQENELLSSNVDELIKTFKNNKHKQKYSNIFFSHEENAFVFFLNTEREIKNYIVFEKNIVVELNTIYRETDSITFNIRTNLELFNFIKQTELDFDRITLLSKDNKKLKDFIDIIHLYIKNNILKLQIIKGDIPDIKFEKNYLEMGTDYYSLDVYSKYIDLYFPSINKKKEDNLFTFINSPERMQIRNNIMSLNNSKTIKKYKITGPFSIGKSMTLFKISKSWFNIVYINLKAIKEYRSNYYRFLEILFEESSRVMLTETKREEFKKKIKLISLEKGILDILIQVMKLFLEINGNKNITLILDQFKSSNIDYDLSFKEKIEELNRQTNLKVVYCSSINDNETRDELMPTFIKFKGNIIELNEETQEFYFYYSELYTSPKSNDITYLLFNNKLKYIEMIDKNDYKGSLKKVDEKIINKLERFKNYQNSKDILINNYNLVDILIFLKDIVTEEKEYSTSNLLNLVSICPLKYFVIHINQEKDKFKIKPIFPYIKFFISEYIKKQDNAEYFEKEKYKNISFLSNKVKGEYFEYAAKIELKKSLGSKHKIYKEIYVDQIAEMNLITTPLDYLLLTLKKQIMQDNQEEKEEIIDGEIKDLNSGENIKINLDDPINEEELKEKIRESYKKDIKDFNIFGIKEILEREKEEILKKFNSFGLDECYEDYVNNILFKGIDAYRIEEFEKRVNKRYEEIEKIIKKAKVNNKIKRKIEIPIKKKSKIDNENKNIDKYNGNENILIDQTNTNGKVVDYAFLFGDKNEKKLLLFQMKCYSSDTSLNEIFINKGYLKKALSSMLINSIKLFNCKIKEWHYILIFYYNDMDDMTNNVGLKTIFSCINRDIEYILFNPVRNKYYMRGNNFNIIEKKNLDLITNESNLDQFSIIKFVNIMNIEKFNHNIFNDNLKKEYLDALTQFLKELKNININLDYLQKQFNVKNLIYFCHFKIENEIISPRLNLIFLYKKKNSNYFIAVKNSFNTIICYDLEKNENIPKFLDLIDYQYEFVYVLSFEEKKIEKRTFNETGNKAEFLFFKRDPLPKLE